MNVTITSEQFIQALANTRPSLSDGIAFEQWRKDVKAIAVMLAPAEMESISTFVQTCENLNQGNINRRI